MLFLTCYKSPLAFTFHFPLKSHVLTFAFLVTGTIQVARRLDRDVGELRQNPTISLEVLVKDRPFGGQENRMQITFKVADINDNPATCSTFTFRYSILRHMLGISLLLSSLAHGLSGYSPAKLKNYGLWDVAREKQ